MKPLTLMLVAGGLIFILIACAAAKQENRREQMPHIAILLGDQGQYIVENKQIGFNLLKERLDALRPAHGAVWYARENGRSAPTAMQVTAFEQLLDYVAALRLPMRMFTDGAFTQALDENGKPINQEPGKGPAL